MLFDNHPNDLNEQDFFDYKDKGTAIASFLKSEASNLGKNKMFALYGEWGSGKTSLMKYISKELTRSNYKTFFFEAWKHEKDEDINTSLLDLITESLDNKERLKAFFAGLRAFGKGLSYKSELLGLELDFEKAISGTEEELKKIREKISFYGKAKLFEEKFNEIEKEILKREKKNKIIVFVDDLDRCEPDNILNLLTTIKLFFTLGEDIIFFFGIDKKAVHQAVNSRYRDIVKSEEYLEKIFDVSFNMPVVSGIYELINFYFAKSETEDKMTLNHFFYQIKFDNPRHIKKIINKFELLLSFKRTDNLKHDLKKLIPNILDEEGKGDVIETIFAFYFIVLAEFYPDKLKDLFNLDAKRLNYGNAYQLKMKSEPGQAPQIESAIRSVQLIQLTEAQITVSELIKQGTNPDNSRLEKLLLTFTPNEVLHFSFDMHEYELLRLFDSNKYSIEIGFCQFLIQSKKKLQKSDSKYMFRNYLQMVQKLL